MRGEWYPRSGMAGKGGKSTSSGILELSKNKSTNSFKQGWEKTTWEEIRQQLRQSSEQPWLQGHKAVLLGIRQHTIALSCELHQDTAQRHVCKALPWAPQHSRVLWQQTGKFHPLPQVCQVSYKSSKPSFPLHIQLSQSWTSRATSVGSHSLI